MVYEQLISDMDYAVENEKTLVLNISFGENQSCGVSTEFELHRFEYDDHGIIMFSGTNVYSICLDEVSVTHDHNEYCIEGNGYLVEIEIF